MPQKSNIEIIDYNSNNKNEKKKKKKIKSWEKILII